MRTSAIVIAALFASVQSIKLTNQFADGMEGTEELGVNINLQNNRYHYAQQTGICDGPNGANAQDCRTSRHNDQNPVCSGRKGEEKERNCVDRPALAQGICDGPNGANAQDCRTARHND